MDDDSSKKISKDVTSAADNTSKQQQVAPPPPIFIHNLSISSPRQRTSSPLSSSHSNSNNNNDEEEVVIKLPPLRPEEPVASLRGALTEVIGFAHLTKYRLVVEKKPQLPPSNSDGESNDGKQIKSGKGQNNTKNNTNNNNNKKKQDVVWSTYTLRNAVVSTPSTLQCLQTDTTVANNNGGKEEEEELVLDDYGDLSILLPLLQQSDVDSSSSNNTNNSSNSSNEEETKEELILLNGHITPRSPPPQQILDASNYTIRIILEKYTISSIKDHVMRVRSMLVDGGLPFVSSLVADESSEAEEVAIEDKEGEKEKSEAKVNGEKGDKGKVRSIILICAVSIYSSRYTSYSYLTYSYNLSNPTHSGQQ